MSAALRLAFATACIGAISFAGPAAATFVLTYEAPGVQNSTATFSSVGVETFDLRPIGSNETFTTTFGISPFSGTYSGVDIFPATQYGGAGGTTRYASTASVAGYSVTLSRSVDYFGYWLSALDRSNVVSFYDDANLVGQFNAGTVLGNVVMNNPAYFGNPDAAFLGQNGTEPYAFVNFFDTGVGATFNRIVFSESPANAGYETDNHTVGLFQTIGGTPIPEPGTYALVAVGLVGLGLARRRPRVVAH